MFAGERCCTLVGYVYVLTLLLSPWFSSARAVFAVVPSWATCTPSCYVRPGVKFARECRNAVVDYVYALTLLLWPSVMFTSGSCLPVIAVLACYFVKN